MTRRNISSGGPWEAVVGYSRAVRVGDVIHVAGSTAAQPDGSVASPGDAYAQAKAALATIEKALTEAGSSLTDVVRTRVYLTDIGHWQEVGRAHGELFGTIKPASTMLQVSRLVHPDMLVEIEAEAIVTPQGGG